AGNDRFIFHYEVDPGHAGQIERVYNLEIVDPTKKDTFVFDSDGAVKSLNQLNKFVTVTDGGKGGDVTVHFTTGNGTVEVTFDGIGTGKIHSLSALNKVIKLQFI